MGSNMGQIGNQIGSAIQSFGNYSAQAASRANGVSFAAQNAQGNFNAGQAAIANNIGSERIAEQYGFNSGQAAAANAFTQQMWDRSAAWNEEMFNRQLEFNREEAQKNRDWQEMMAKTAYQRATADMKAAGLNPILAVTGGGISTGSGGGSAASVSSPQMSGASGAMASGGLMNGISASEGNFTGQMEYMAGTLGLLGAAISGISSAFGNLGQLGDIGREFGEALGNIFDPDRNKDQSHDYVTGNDKYGGIWFKEGSTGEKIWNGAKDLYGAIKNKWYKDYNSYNKN